MLDRIPKILEFQYKHLFLKVGQWCQSPGRPQPWPHIKRQTSSPSPSTAFGGGHCHNDGITLPTQLVKSPQMTSAGLVLHIYSMQQVATKMLEPSKLWQPTLAIMVGIQMARIAGQVNEIGSLKKSRKLFIRIVWILLLEPQIVTTYSQLPIRSNDL